MNTLKGKYLNCQLHFQLQAHPENWCTEFVKADQERAIVFWSVQEHITFSFFSFFLFFFFFFFLNGKRIFKLKSKLFVFSIKNAKFHAVALRKFSELLSSNICHATDCKCKWIEHWKSISIYNIYRKFYKYNCSL